MASAIQSLDELLSLAGDHEGQLVYDHYLTCQLSNWSARQNNKFRTNKTANTVTRNSEARDGAEHFKESSEAYGQSMVPGGGKNEDGGDSDKVEGLSLMKESYQVAKGRWRPPPEGG